LIRSIQYLRALAALMVVWVHALYVMPQVGERLGAQYFLPNSAVDIFFLISGFVMVVTTTRKDMTPVGFFRLRLIRVVPLYWLATIAMIAIPIVLSALPGHAFQDTHYPPAAITKSLLFVPYAAIEGVPGSVWPIVQQGWTLNYEMFFYALFALSLAAPRRLRLPGLAITLVSLVLLGRLFGPFASPLAAVYTSPMLLDLAAGMILAHAWLRAGSWSVLPLSLLFIVFGFYAIGAEHSRIVTMGGAFIIFAGCLHPRICAIQNRPLMELGNASYSLYLIHQFVLDACAWIWRHVFPLATWVSSAFFMAFALLLCAAAGLLCYRFIERPLTSQLLGFITAPIGSAAVSTRRPSTPASDPGARSQARQAAACSESAGRPPQ
jgi:exopolysaccharide production protein ExoZ